VKLRPYMRAVSRRADSLGMIVLLWRRQSGKTTWIGWRCLKIMAEAPHRLATLVSASLAVGSELSEKEAMVLAAIIADMQKQASAAGQKIETTAGDGGWEAILDRFDKGRLEVRLWHDKTSYSRTKIIAPNPATARGYSGWVFVDEFGFIRDFKSVYEAVEPIMSSDPNFRIVMATTPPDDDAHYSYELTMPPDDAERVACAEGTWYESQAGVMCHRVDAFDCDMAGVRLYDTKTREPLSAAEHRARALDRVAWERNYGIRHIAGGTAAVALTWIQHAQMIGAATCAAAEDELPGGWSEFVTPGLPTVIGVDPATSEKQKANPTGAAIAQQTGRGIRLPVVARYRIGDDLRQIAVIRELVEGCKARGCQVTLGLDASSEVLFARRVRRELGGICRVVLTQAGAVTEAEKGKPAHERVNFKTASYNTLLNHMEDGTAEVPAARWLRDDWRLVRRAGGGFQIDLGNDGSHGDSFVASAIAAHLLSHPGGEVDIECAAIGSDVDGRTDEDDPEAWAERMDRTARRIA